MNVCATKITIRIPLVIRPLRAPTPPRSPLPFEALPLLEVTELLIRGDSSLSSGRFYYLLPGKPSSGLRMGSWKWPRLLEGPGFRCCRVQGVS